MTYDDLKNVRRQRLRVDALQDRINRLRERAAFTAQQLGERINDNTARDRLAEYVAELDDLETHLTQETITLEHAIHAVDHWLSELPSNREPIMRLHYCEALPWKLVALETHYCTDWCKQIDGRYRKELTQTHF